MLFVLLEERNSLLWYTLWLISSEGEREGCRKLAMK